MKSKKNLLIVIGVIIVVVALFFVFKGNNFSKISPLNENALNKTLSKPSLLHPPGKIFCGGIVKVNSWH